MSGYRLDAVKRILPLGGGWSRWFEVEGQRYCASVLRGRRVRIPWKPRGENIGWTWDGQVVTDDGTRVWAGRVSGSIGVRGLAVAAGLLLPKPRR